MYWDVSQKNIRERQVFLTYFYKGYKFDIFESVWLAGVYINGNTHSSVIEIFDGDYMSHKYGYNIRNRSEFPKILEVPFYIKSVESKKYRAYKDVLNFGS